MCSCQEVALGFSQLCHWETTKLSISGVKLFLRSENWKIEPHAEYPQGGKLPLSTALT